MLFYSIVYFVSHQVQVCEFISEFRGKILQYIQHVDMERWQDEKFRICSDTFPLGTILSMVEFAENYTLQPQNETSVLSLRAGEHNGPYHLSTSAR